MELHEYELEGSAMVLNWGKAVKINANPFAVQSAKHPSISQSVPSSAPVIPSVSESTKESASLSDTVPTTQPTADRPASIAVGSKWDAPPVAPVVMKESDPRITVVVPQDPRIRRLIDLTAKFVAVDGESFEKVNNLFINHPDLLYGYIL